MDLMNPSGLVLGHLSLYSHIRAYTTYYERTGGTTHHREERAASTNDYAEDDATTELALGGVLEDVAIHIPGGEGAAAGHKTSDSAGGEEDPHRCHVVRAL